MSQSEVRHAGLVARRLRGRWLGTLIEGPSGSGKSDLALRALAQGFRLVSDDRTVVFGSAGRLFGKAPTPLRGLIEVRAVDVIGQAEIPLAEIVMVVCCLGEGESAPRLAEPDCVRLCGIEIPRLSLAALEGSAMVKLSAALEQLGARRQAEYLASRSRIGPLPPRAHAGL